MDRVPRGIRYEASVRHMWSRISTDELEDPARTEDEEDVAYLEMGDFYFLIRGCA